jgi:hypothetical protein
MRQRHDRSVAAYAQATVKATIGEGPGIGALTNCSHEPAVAASWAAQCHQSQLRKKYRDYIESLCCWAQQAAAPFRNEHQLQNERDNGRNDHASPAAYRSPGSMDVCIRRRARA